MNCIKRTFMFFLIIVGLLYHPSLGFPHGDEVEVPSKENATSVTLSPAEIQTLGVKTVKAGVRTIRETFSVSGMIKPLPDEVAVVSGRASGKVVRIFVSPGDSVQKGAALAEIFSPELEQLHTSFQQTKSKMDFLLKEKERAQNLFERKIGTLKEVQQKESDYETGKKELQGLTDQIHALGLKEEEPHSHSGSFSTLMLRSPLKGIVMERNATIGESFSGEKPLFRVANISRVIAEGDAFEDKLPFLKKGKEVSVETDTYPEKSFRGKISYVSYEIDPEKRTLHFWAEISNKNLLLRSNMYVTINVVTSEKSVPVALPKEAIFNENDKRFVLVQEDHSFEKRPVILGISDDQYAEIKSGVEEGEPVVTSGKREIYTRLLTGKNSPPGKE